MRKFILPLFISFFYYNISYSQSLTAVLNSVIDDSRNNRKLSMYNELNDYMNKNPYDVALAIRTYTIDTSVTVKKLVINVLGRTGILCESVYLRSNICEIISSFCNDKNKEIRSEAFSRLRYFQKSDFNNNCKFNIITCFRNRMQVEPLAIKIGGFISPDGLDTVFRNILNENINNNNITWSLKIALARLGSHEAEDYCITQAKRYGINDGYVFEIIPDLIYTRSIPVLNYVISQIYNDDKQCYSTNPDNPEKIICAFRIIENIAPIIKDFPIKTTTGGDLKCNDYNEALFLCRKWFKEHENNYELLTNLY